jgi:predicted outer membrane protein
MFTKDQQIMTRRFIMAFLVTSMAVTAQVTPQPQPQPHTNPPSNTMTGATGATGMATSDEDRFFATCIAIANDNEIALAQLAEQKAQNPEVKEFAKKMVEDHTKFGEKLRQYAAPTTGNPMGRSGVAPGERGLEPGQHPGDTSQPPVARGEGDRNRIDTSRGRGLPESRRTDDMGRRANETGGVNTGLDAGNVDHVALMQELGQQCLSTAKRELESKSGAEFDKCYVGMAIAAHAMVNDELTVFSRHASSNLRTVFQEGQPTVQAHLDHAKNLIKTLDSNKSGNSEKKPTDQK